MSSAQFGGFWEHWWWLFVKGYHVGEFALLSLLLLRAFGGRLWLSSAASFAYAASDEFHQTFVPFRGGRWTDVAIDSIGIALVVAGVLLFRWTDHRRQLGPHPSLDPKNSASIGHELPDMGFVFGAFRRAHRGVGKEGR